MRLHACANGKWDEKHVIAFVEWDVRCNDMETECEKWNDNAFACSEGKTSFWEKLATSPNGEKPTNKHTKPKQKKNIPLKTTQNMPRCNALQRWNSNLELGEEPKISKWRRNSYLKEKCTF